MPEKTNPDPEVARLAAIKEHATAYLMNAGLSMDQIRKLEMGGYFEAPASKSHHLNRLGGLAEHSVHVCDQMIKLKAFAERKSCFRVGMLHDLVKMVCYYRKDNGAYEYRAPNYPGHGVCSAIMCHELEVPLTRDERLAIIWHMGAFGLDENGLKEYHTALRIGDHRSIVLTHAADHLASLEEK